MVEQTEIERCYRLLGIEVPIDDLTTDHVLAAWYKSTSGQFPDVICFGDLPYDFPNNLKDWPEIFADAKDTLLNWLKESPGDKRDDASAFVPRKPFPTSPDSAIALPLPDQREDEEI